MVCQVSGTQPQIAFSRYVRNRAGRLRLERLTGVRVVVAQRAAEGGNAQDAL